MGDRKIFPFSGKQAGKADRADLLAQLQEVIVQLNSAYRNFDGALEPELVEACIYEINALQSRYAYLLRAAREQGLQNVEVFRFPRSDEPTVHS